MVIETNINKDKSHVLCTLVGNLAIAGSQTQNGTIYGHDVWESIENSESFKRMMDSGSFVIGIDHPDELERASLSSIYKEASAIVTKYERKPTGEIVCEYDVLDTPGGQIINTLARYGTAVGVSTRMLGDVDEKGNVSPNGVEFLGADFVVDPSQKDSRLKLKLNEGKTISNGSLLTEEHKSQADEFLLEYNKIHGKSVNLGKSNNKLIEGRLVGEIAIDNKEDYELTSDGYFASKVSGELINTVSLMENKALLENGDIINLTEVKTLVKEKPNKLKENKNIRGGNKMRNKRLEGREEKREVKKNLAEGVIERLGREKLKEGRETRRPMRRPLKESKLPKVVVKLAENRKLEVFVNGELKEVAQMERGERLSECKEILVKEHTKMALRESRRPTRRLEGRKLEGRRTARRLEGRATRRPMRRERTVK